MTDHDVDLTTAPLSGSISGESRRTAIGRRVLWVAGPALILLGILVMLLPFSISSVTYGIESRSCGSALVPSHSETLSGESAVLQDWVTERDCRSAGSARALAGTFAILFGGFLVFAAAWQSRATTASLSLPPSS